MEPHVLALSKAKIALMSKSNSVFFSTLVMGLRQTWDDSTPIAKTNGIEIKLNPDYFQKLTQPQQIGLLTHEALHVGFDHAGRRGSKDKERYNKACDHVINNMLIDGGFEIPPGGYCDRKYAGKSAEEVYDLLEDSPSNPDQMDLGDPGGDGEEDGEGQGNSNSDGNNPSDGSSTTPAHVKQQIQEALMRAVQTAQQAGKEAGNIPGMAGVLLDSMINPKLPWHRILQKFLSAFSKTDYSFRKPNRRHFPRHFLPSLFAEAIPNFAVFPDLSGSTSDHEVSVMISEVSKIFKVLKPEEVRMVPFDTRILDDIKVRSLQELRRLDFHGRGGTNITPVIQWIEKNKPEFGLIFSDGEFSPPKVHTKVPVIWLIYNNPTFTAPFGKVIHFKI